MMQHAVESSPLRKELLNIFDANSMPGKQIACVSVSLLPNFSIRRSFPWNAGGFIRFGLILDEPLNPERRITALNHSTQLQIHTFSMSDWFECFPGIKTSDQKINWSQIQANAVLWSLIQTHIKYDQSQTDVPPHTSSSQTFGVSMCLQEAANTSVSHFGGGWDRRLERSRWINAARLEPEWSHCTGQWQWTSEYYYTGIITGNDS